MDTSRGDLDEVLAPATIMIVSVSCSTTKGEPLDDEELKRVLEACDMALDLDEAKSKIMGYVESRMYFLAPNLTHICGATTAAKIMGAAGGLTSLSKMPACNVQVLGQQKRALGGFSSGRKPSPGSPRMIRMDGRVFYCTHSSGRAFTCPHSYDASAHWVCLLL